MIRFNKAILIAFVLFFLSSCEDINDNDGKGVFPNVPVNLSDANSPYDDYNLDIKYINKTIGLMFSTNRHSQGKNFDIISICVDFQYVQDDNLYTNVYEYADYVEDFYNQILSKINTKYNEFGPYSISGVLSDNKILQFIANDSTGNLDIYFLKYFQNTAQPEDVEISDVYNAKVLNSDFDDAYPSFNSKADKIFFTSNRDGQFDIFSVDVPDSINIFTWLNSDASHRISRVSVLNSSADDKCPFLNGNLLVFTSDRAGGYGGFDLWYSLYENGDWTEPVNFGDSINTQYDEYRPVTALSINFENDLMLFSSNKPTGQGGFDLYYVGIPKMIE